MGGALLLMADFDAGVEEKGVLEDDEAEFDGEAGERGLWVMVLHFFAKRPPEHSAAGPGAKRR